MDKVKILFIILFLLIIIGIFFLSTLSHKDDSNQLKIYFFNAGKADAILISKNNKYMMIDTGEESLSNAILTYFRLNHITKLEYLIITHFDKDHVGSASSIIDAIEIGEVLQSNVPKESEYYTNYLNSLNNKNITPITVSGEKNLLLESVSITINGPDKIYDTNESNNSSLIVSLTNGTNKFLFMGDAENARIKDFMSKNTTTYDVIKIPYHGNYLKELNNLLDNIKTKYGIITCSNTKGCEDKTLDVLNEYSIKYYLTKNGSITVLSDGNTISVKQS